MVVSVSPSRPVLRQHQIRSLTLPSTSLPISLPVMIESLDPLEYDSGWQLRYSN